MSSVRLNALQLQFPQMFLNARVPGIPLRQSLALSQLIDQGATRMSRTGVFGETTCLEFVSNTNYLVGGTSSGCVHLWSCGSRALKSTKVWQAHTQPIIDILVPVTSSLSYSNNVSNILTASEDGLLKLWNTEQLMCPVRTFAGHTGTLLGTAMASSECGKLNVYYTYIHT